MTVLAVKDGFPVLSDFPLHAVSLKSVPSIRYSQLFLWLSSVKYSSLSQYSQSSRHERKKFSRQSRMSSLKFRVSGERMKSMRGCKMISSDTTPVKGHSQVTEIRLLRLFLRSFVQ